MADSTWRPLTWCEGWELAKTVPFGFMARDRNDNRVWFKDGALGVSGFDGDELLIPDVLIRHLKELSGV